MFGISFAEFVIIAILLVLVVNPQDAPKLLKHVFAAFKKLRTVTADFNRQIRKLESDIGLNDTDDDLKNLKSSLNADLSAKTDIVDLDGKTQKAYDITKMRGDITKKQAEIEIARLNRKLAKTKIPETSTASKTKTKTKISSKKSAKSGKSAKSDISKIAKSSAENVKKPSQNKED